MGKQNQISAVLDLQPIGGKVSKNKLIEEVWGVLRPDFFIVRSFDVFFHHAKKQLAPKKFRCNSGMITRIE